MTDATAIIRDPLFKKHEMTPGHPESPGRLVAIDRMIDDAPSNLAARLSEVDARDATAEELSWVHTDGYLRMIEDTAGKPHVYLDPDTSTNEYSWDAAKRAAGAAIAAVDAVFSDAFHTAFAFVRPPGHHAESDRAMGFCLLNNVAVAAEYAIHALSLNRVAIVDWDVHHGNGTMHSFYSSGKVLYVSLHQYPHYPGTGSAGETGMGDGSGFTVNLPFPSGMRDADYRYAFDAVIVPILDEFRPELILVSAGFDAHAADPLAGMQLSSQMYGEMAGALLSVAERHCAGRIAAVLEGGYSPVALAEGCASVLQAFAGETPHGRAGDASRAAVSIVESACAHLSKKWKCLSG